MPRQSRQSKGNARKETNLTRFTRRREAEAQLTLFVSPRLEGQEQGKKIVQRIKRELQIEDTE